MLKKRTFLPVDRSVIRLYAEISLFAHSTTISLSPFITRPRKRSRAFPSFSERFRAFRSFLRFPSQYSRAQLLETRSMLHCVTQIRHHRPYAPERIRVFAIDRVRVALRYLIPFSSMSNSFLVASRKPLFLVIPSPTDIRTYHFN